MNLTAQMCWNCRELEEWNASIVSTGRKSSIQDKMSSRGIVHSDECAADISNDERQVIVACCLGWVSLPTYDRAQHKIVISALVDRVLHKSAESHDLLWRLALLLFSPAETSSWVAGDGNGDYER